MAVTVGGTSITFNDGTVQSTAALNSIAAASVGSVGSYAFLRHLTAANRSPGATAAGSEMRYSTGGGGQIPSPIPSGTWRLMGQTGYDGTGSPGSTSVASQVSLWLRIS